MVMITKSIQQNAIEQEIHFIETPPNRVLLMSRILRTCAIESDKTISSSPKICFHINLENHSESPFRLSSQNESKTT